MKIQPVRGTHDLFNKALVNYKYVESTIRDFANIYNFDEIITPIFESTELFEKPLGPTSDVVLKEMYTFKDINNSSLTLRPEYTTPMIRAAISNNILEKLPTKLFGMGPMFRRERPQRGRYRQFNQVNFEILGTNDPMADIELISLADSILKNIFQNTKIDLHINSLGDKNTLEKYKENLKLYFEKYKNSLSQDSQKKIYTNPLRILDSKNPEDEEIKSEAPKISDYYTKDIEKKFNEIKNLLSESDIDFEVNQNLVRGLDYYCHLVFEFKSNALNLGSQNTLIGGGRYDGLIKLLGGPDLPGIGWAGGLDRIIMTMKEFILKEKKVYLIIMEDRFKNYGLKLLNLLRKNNISVFFDYKYNLKKSLSHASQFKFDYAVIIGENETKNNTCTIKNLNDQLQKIIPSNEIIKTLI